MFVVWVWVNLIAPNLDIQHRNNNTPFQGPFKYYSQQYFSRLRLRHCLRNYLSVGGLSSPHIAAQFGQSQKWSTYMMFSFLANQFSVGTLARKKVCPKDILLGILQYQSSHITDNTFRKRNGAKGGWWCCKIISLAEKKWEWDQTTVWQTFQPKSAAIKWL